jgi:hypothetical protein
MADRITVLAPLDCAYRPVVRQLVGGVTAHASFTFEDMEDLQLAIERLLAEAGPEGRVALSFELGESRIRTRVGPLPEGRLTEALGQPDGGASRLTLRRILTTVVDSYGVEAVDGNGIVVHLEKLVRGGG